MGKGKNKARREIAEQVAWGLFAFILREDERRAAALGYLEARDASQRREAANVGIAVEPGLGGAWYRTWLYSGDDRGRRFGARRDGQIRCKQTNSGGNSIGRLDEELQREERYRRAAAALDSLDRHIVILWGLARAAGVGDCGEWVQEQLLNCDRAAHRTNSDGKPWTVEAVRKRISRINERIARRVVDEIGGVAAAGGRAS